VMSVTIVALVASIAGFSRMYRGMHHLSDVVAGAILGLASVLVTRAILLRTAACRPEERELLEEGGEAPACS
ncbi:MAG: superfamily, partial [Ilumatobacteraceae bacterium]|nr:superfamily [Ilumatobacteraceae bacterium]